MGAIELEPPESTWQEIKAEECVGEGGHQFERIGGVEPDGCFPVVCLRCCVYGIEHPDEADEGYSDETKDVL